MKYVKISNEISNLIFGYLKQMFKLDFVSLGHLRNTMQMLQVTSLGNT